MSLLTSKPAETIAGYTVKERIGVGGYGEVWKAEAPGGLTKAVKFIYGCHDDKRATDELKSLGRIKEVRHPFLLSLERIEVVDGQLMIITELADSSLKDRFEQCRMADLPGIPRDELLVYLRDAADALDYMSENYSLQHLDIKPENLLTVGGHVKVADFGLVKDIQNTTVSIMGGLTPSYASPEVFDGRPSLHSDQYSLAIVYQEMLTGEPPFPGKTASQLMNQHLHGKPCLTSLSRADRPVIEKALAKDPEARFPSCRQMIEALLAARLPKQEPQVAIEDVISMLDSLDEPAPPAAEPSQASTSKETSTGKAPATSVPDTTATVKTAVFEVSPPTDRLPAEAAGALKLPTLGDVGEIETLPPIKVSSDEVGLQPTLIVGIGGVATRTLRRLTRRLRDRFTDPSQIPVIQTMLIDTDTRALGHATEGDPGSALAHHATLGLPLRRRENYRGDSDQFLQWLSRRWLYNIPRSLQTEGLRPLGRLALVDHSEKLFVHLREVLSAMLAPEALELSRKTTGLKTHDKPPQVFVVASTSGGTGSGMVLDVAYAVRMVLAGLNVSDEAVHGILMHGTPRNSDAKDLAIANTYACLNELHHYGRIGRHLGEGFRPALAGDENLGAFDDAYLIHLGDDLSEAAMDTATDTVAEYLYLNTVTAGGAFFEKCRRKAEEDTGKEHEKPTLRTFGLCQIGCSQSSIPATLARLLCQQVVGRWCGDSGAEAEESGEARSAEPSAHEGDVTASGLDTDDTTHDETEPFPLDLERLIAEVCDCAGEETGGDTEAYLRACLEKKPASKKAKPSDDNEAPAVSHFFAVLNTLLGTRSENDSLQANPEGSLHEALDAQLKPLAARLAETTCDWIFRSADPSETSVRQTRQVTNRANARLREFTEEASVLLQRMQVPLVQAEHVILTTSYPDQLPLTGWFGFGRSRRRIPDLDTQWLKYFQLRLDQAVLHRTCKLLKSIQTRVQVIDDQLRALGGELNLLAEEFSDPSEDDLIHAASGASSDTLSDLYLSVADALHGRIPELAAELDDQLQTEFFAKQGGLRGVLGKKTSLRGPFADALRGAARTAVFRALNQMNIAELLLASDKGASESNQPLRALLEAAMPPLLQAGGSQRLLLVCPEGSDDAALQEAFRRHLEEKPSVVHDSDGDLVLCYEAEQLPLATVAARLIQNRPDYAQAASRLHTRIDVKWTPLLPIE